MPVRVIAAVFFGAVGVFVLLLDPVYSWARDFVRVLAVDILRTKRRDKCKKE